MKTIQDIASLITIRTFLAASIENLGVKLTREELKGVQNKISALDKVIVEESIKLDLLKVGKDNYNVVREISVQSSENTEEVFKKFTEKDLNGVSGAKLTAEINSK